MRLLFPEVGLNDKFKISLHNYLKQLVQELKPDLLITHAVGGLLIENLKTQKEVDV